uniref:Uncharacterized protein n=1 Tax=Candidatus Kentrum sp. LFY TaxID=2126342 RepID=A0A450WD22_9GAMM|nr:MAG: hypothetical protein BECKLFY1418C_GA0070996_101213 [Candidatus Kentron sp. LFY]
MKNTMTDVRNLLIETIESVKSGDMAIDKAKAIAQVAGVVVDSGKVEVDFLKALAELPPTQEGHYGTGFISAERPKQIG